jgi:serine phosphatase RsbU (regulator of sigma subunit)
VTVLAGGGPPDATAVARRLHSCLGTDEIRATLDALLPSGTGWSVLYPAGDGFTVHTAGAGLPVARPDPALSRSLEGWWEREPRLAPVEGGAHLAPDAPAVRAACPLTFRDEKYGLFLLHGDGEPDLAWWQEVVDALAPGLVKAQLYEAANRESASSGTKLDALNEAGGLVRHVELHLLLTKLMELSVRIMHAQVGAIVLLEDGDLVSGIEWGLREELLLGLRTPDGESFLQRYVLRGEPVLIEDAGASDLLETSDLDVRLESLVAVPLVSQDRPLGAIVVVNSGEGRLSPEDAEVLATIANMSANAVENALLYEQTREHERMTAEMTLASDLQKSLLPRTHPRTASIETAGWCMSASETGGDFYDFLDMGEGRLGVVIGDATGHGMGAALIVFIARSTLRALLDGEHDLERVLTRMNDLVEQDFDDDRFITFYFGVWDERERTLRYTSAGHDPPLLYRPATDEFTEHVATGTPLGILPGMTFPPRSVRLEPGDFLLFGTDGIWEALNPAGEFYGKDRLKAAVRAAHALPIDEAAEHVRRDILEFHEGREQHDDITAVFLRVR